MHRFPTRHQLSRLEHWINGKRNENAVVQRQELSEYLKPYYPKKFLEMTVIFALAIFVIDDMTPVEENKH